LKDLASIFDPLGFFQPVVFPGKLFLQKLWMSEYSWDSVLDDERADEWSSIRAEISGIFGVRLPRFVGRVDDRSTLVVFSDASMMGYGACVYLRTYDGEKFSSNLIFSKSRLSPPAAKKNKSARIRKVTIPRLELLGAVVGSHVGKFCREALKCDLPICFFVDSKCVLYWLKREKQDGLKLFVSRRVEIMKSVEKCEYRYVSTDENPADYLTKGKSAEGLKSDELWWHGPSWLCKEKSEWPDGFPVISDETVKQAASENKLVFQTLAATEIDEMKGPLSINIRDFSTLRGLLQRTATVLVAVKKLVWQRLSVEQKQRFSVLRDVSDCLPLSANDIDAATKMWVKWTQSLYFGDVLQALEHGKRHSLIFQLGLKLDADGILRSYSRYSHAELPEYSRQPVLLPSDSSFTKLVVLDVHERVGHSGIAHTLIEFRQRYWIPHGKATVRKILGKCLICRRYKGGTFGLPLMPSWPAERVSRSVPFEYAGLDYFGPVKVSVRGEMVKMWGCLFTCLVTRAVHIEAVSDCSSHEFLNALIRFVSRRSCPKQIISDNAAQFRLVNILGERAWKKVPTDKSVLTYAAQRGIRWKFITELAPWMGGHYERLVGVVKSVLRVSIGRRLLSWSDFVTLTVETEAIVNSRPITFVGADIADQFAVLRPVDFLTNGPTSTVTTESEFSVGDLGEGGRLLASV